MPQIHSDDIKTLLQRYGLANPTAAEIAIFEGIDVIGGAAEAAIGAYANAKTSEMARQKNDPLAAYQELTQKYTADSITSAGNLYNQLQGVLSEAPKLFGGLTPDQVQSYLAPLQTSYKTALSNVQGIIASRGLSASSTENAALAETNKQFQDQVFSTGLDVGMKSQQAKANSIQAQINNLFGFGTSAMGESGAAARQRSAQDLGQSNLIASLPYFLRSTGQQDAAAKIASDQWRSDNSGFQHTFDQVTGDIQKGAGAFNALKSMGVGGGGGGGGTPYTPSGPSYSQFAPQTPGYGAPASYGPGGTNFAPPNLDLFAATL